MNVTGIIPLLALLAISVEPVANQTLGNIRV